MSTATLPVEGLDLKEICRRLEDERKWLASERRRCRALQEEDVEVEEGDVAALQAARELCASLDEQLVKRISAIDRAEERLHAGTYGVCLLCGEPISILRLTAIPSAELCRGCQERADGR